MAGEFSPAPFLGAARAGLGYFADLLQDTSPFDRALDAVERGLVLGASCAEMAGTLGTGIAALYCFLRHATSFADVIHNAVFIGGDTDTIASMAGAVAGALLGDAAIPPQWAAAIREERYDAAGIRDVADRLYEKFVGDRE